MNPMRERARELLPQVMLTLLSMIQALAVELLWTRLHEEAFLWNGGWPAAIGWAQAFVMGLGILQIWLFQVSLVLRFEWVPTPSDSILPFFVGVLEFATIDLIGPTYVGLWLFLFGMLFAISFWTSQMTFRRARSEPANDAFFRHVGPATLRDYLPVGAGIGLIWACGLIVYVTGVTGWLAFAAVAVAGVLIAHQVHITRHFWIMSLDADRHHIDLDAPADLDD